MSMDASSISDYVTDHIPEIILLIGGLIALSIVVTHLRNEGSLKHKALVVLGVLFGVLMIFMCVSSYSSWPWFTSIIIAVAGFTLAIRPFRDVPFAAILSILIMVIIYIFLGELDGTAVEFIAEGWPRIIAAFLIGAVAFMILNFAENLIKVFGKLFNWWPVLFVLGLICIIEAVLILTGYGSLYDLLR